jgi:thiamine-phosphate diphosphorylase
VTDREAIEIAGKLNNLCQLSRSLFVVNDRVDIALAVGAAGVHLGVDDMPLQDARRLSGSGVVIGYSPETDEQAASAAGRGADYLGIGPVFGTSSKSDAGDAIGLETLRRRVSLAGIPVVGIGGISPRNAAEVVEAGAVGVAVASAILGSSDPRRVADELVSNVSRARVW